MKKNLLLLMLLFTASQIFAQELQHQIQNSRREAGTVLLRTKIQSTLQQYEKGLGLKFKSPVAFTSLALAWQTDLQHAAPSSFTVHYRVHSPSKGWRKWAEEEGAYAPADHSLGNYYTTDLLFGIDEAQHDSIEFYLEMPTGIKLQEVQLILQDMSGHAEAPVIDNGTQKNAVASCPAQPTTIPRSGWCGSYTACHTPTYTPAYITATHTVIHHGASPDTYTDGYAVVRSYWNYHVNTLGWSDIGYNFLLDKNGNIFIGRHNPNFPASDVRGAHAGSANSKSIGVSFLGNADVTGNVPQTTLNRATDLLAWWYNLRGLNPTTSANIINQPGTLTINLPRICGHKDLNATSCPGTLLYNYLPTFRTNAQQLITNCQTVAAPAVSVSAGCGTGSVTLTVTVSANQTFQLLNSTGTTVIQSWTGTASSYTFTGVSSGTYTGRIVRNSVTSALSAAATLTNQSASLGGTIAGSSSICQGSTTGTMTLSGHRGTIVRWEKKLSSSTTWTNISNTASTYSETPSSAGSWQYRVLVQNGTCASVYSTTLSITVSSATVGGSLSGTAGAVCLGSSTGTMTLSGHSGAVVRWEKRVNAGSWTNISNTAASYSETPTGAGTWEYRALVQNAGCATAYSTVFSKTVTAASLGGSLSGTAGAICLGSSSGTITLSGQTGSVIRWEKRVNNGTWSSISNTTSTFSETPTAAGNWEYRAVVQNGSCAAAFSSVFAKTVQASSLGGSISSSLSSLCAGQSTGTMTLSGHRGTVIRWEKRLSGGTWTNITTTSATYSEIPSSAGTWEYRALVQNSPCSSVYSTVRTVSATSNAIGSFCHCPIQLSLPVVNYQGNTASYGDNYNPADVTPVFSGLEAYDAVFSFTVSSRSQISATLGASGIWGGMLLTNNCPNPTAPSSYINSYLQWNGGTMTTTLDPGTYMLIVSSSSQWTHTMPFTLNINAAPALRTNDENGLITESEALNMRIYPNPAVDIINISCSGIPQTARIISANGNLILEQQNIGSSQFQMPVYQLQSGLYFIQVIDAQGNMESSSFMIGN